MQRLNRELTTWHITFGTRGARLHGGVRPTVDRKHNQLGEPFIYRDEEREQREHDMMKGEVVILTHEQCAFIEEVMPSICERGGWVYRTCAAPAPTRGRVGSRDSRRRVGSRDSRGHRGDNTPCEPARPRAGFVIDGDHVHVLLDAPKEVHGKQIREIMKRWVTQALNKKWPRPEAGRWWAVGGSTKAIKDEAYLNNAFDYIEGQRATVKIM